MSENHYTYFWENWSKIETNTILYPTILTATLMHTIFFKIISYMFSPIITSKCQAISYMALTSFRCKMRPAALTRNIHSLSPPQMNPPRWCTQKAKTLISKIMLHNLFLSFQKPQSIFLFFFGEGHQRGGFISWSKSVCRKFFFFNFSIRLSLSDTSKLKGEMATHTFWGKLFFYVVVYINVEG